MAVQRVASHAEFAKRVGITFGMASRLCSGDRAASRETLNKIFDAFELSLTQRDRALDAWLTGPVAFGNWLQESLYKRVAA